MHIWWIRRDLRIMDNRALAAAAANDVPVLPVFILDPVFWRPGDVPEKRAAFLLSGLRLLDADLRAKGARLIVRSGRPLEVLHSLVVETGASAIFAEEDYTPYARSRDAAVSAHLPLHLLPGLTVFHPEQVLKADGAPYTVFTPFSKTWKSLPQPRQEDLVSAPSRMLPVDKVESERIPEMPLEPFSPLFPAGETEARRRLAAFVSGPVWQYGENRDRPDLDATSGLSPYFRFGMLSARHAVVEAWDAINHANGRDEEKAAFTWLNELIWREFFQAILYHFPHVRKESFRDTYRALPWENHPEDISAWKNGLTGYPFVDAAMRQMAATGWMHNRARMVVASFLVKDLAVDWRIGERWFMQQLIDGDLAANNGGWQWSAGTGTDAAPYFRIFNPITQSKKFDPQGHYIRRWVPELSRVADDHIHEPWKMDRQTQQKNHCVLGQDYPAPIIDHAWARDRALVIYQQKGK